MGRKDFINFKLQNQFYLKPLFTLNIIYSFLVLNLLNDSLNKLNNDINFYNFATYIMRLIEKFIENNKDEKDINEFYKNVDNLFIVSYKYNNITQIRYQYYYFLKEILDKRDISINYAIKIIKKIIDNNKFINNDRDFIEFMEKKIINEIKRRFNQEGYMDLINKIDHIKENISQKIISLLLENIFLSEGFNKKNLIIHREVEKPDSKRVDFAVKYGFLGTIIIEI